MHVSAGGVCLCVVIVFILLGVFVCGWAECDWHMNIHTGHKGIGSRISTSNVNIIPFGLCALACTCDCSMFWVFSCWRLFHVAHLQIRRLEWIGSNKLWREGPTAHHKDLEFVFI